MLHSKGRFRGRKQEFASRGNRYRSQAKYTGILVHHHKDHQRREHPYSTRRTLYAGQWRIPAYSKSETSCAVNLTICCWSRDQEQWNCKLFQNVRNVTKVVHEYYKEAKFKQVKTGRRLLFIDLFEGSHPPPFCIVRGQKISVSYRGQRCVWVIRKRWPRSSTPDFFKEETKNPSRNEGCRKVGFEPGTHDQ